MCHNGYIMARIKEEDLRLNIIVNGDKGHKKLLELQQQISATTNEVVRLKAKRDNLNESMPS